MKKGDPIYSKINRENIVSAMTTIPPVSVRQVRPCYMCYHCLFESCICRLDKSGNKNVRQYYSRVDPCANNITLAEIEELIDEHNAKEASK